MDFINVGTIQIGACRPDRPFKRAGVIACAVAATHLTGCVNFFVGAPRPVSAPTAAECDATADACITDLVLSWPKADTLALKSIAVAFAGPVRVIQSETSPSLVIGITLRMEKLPSAPSPSERIARYQQQTLSASTGIEGNTPRVICPAAGAPASEGIIAQQMTISLPATKRLALSIEPADAAGAGSSVEILNARVNKAAITLGAGASVIRGLTGDLLLTDGQPETELEVSDVDGNLAAELRHIQRLQLQKITGSVSVRFGSPQSADRAQVTLDQIPLKTFPYFRSRGGRPVSL